MSIPSEIPTTMASSFSQCAGFLISITTILGVGYEG